MIKVIICGASGKMGGFVADACKSDGDIQVVAGVDKINLGQNFPIFGDFKSINTDADVIIDFSNPILLDSILEYAIKTNTAVVLATTGYSDSQIEQIKEASKKIPVFFSFNMSLGVNLICSLAKKAAAVLGDGFDIEIVEKHHNQKIDAPSGTAIMLANAVNSCFGGEKVYEYDRHSKRQKRSPKEIGIHSVRGGTIVGEHDVIFAGHDETVTISHSAQSKEVFAVGSVKAAKFLAEKPADLYDMNSIISFE